MIAGKVMIEFLAGAVTLAFLLAAVYFLRFWRRTSDRLFLHFSWAFALLALNQLGGFRLLAYGRAKQVRVRAARAGLRDHPGGDRRQEHIRARKRG